MQKTVASIWERIFIRIKNVVDRFLYYDNLFDDNVWQVRFSKDNKRKLKYRIERERFSMQLKNGDDVFKYLWMILLAGALVGMLVLSQRIGVSDREIAQNEYSELLYNHFHHIGDPDAYKAHPYAHTQAQTIDLLIYAIAKTLNFQDVYAFRHLLSAIFGWLLVAYLSLILLRAFNWRAAFFTAFFLIISPRFFGYSLSNVGGASTWMNTLKNRQNTYHRYRDYSILATVIVYALSLIDAYVDAQLFDYDISPDLTLNVEPQIYYDLQRQRSAELKVAIQF